MYNSVHKLWMTYGRLQKVSVRSIRCCGFFCTIISRMSEIISLIARERILLMFVSRLRGIVSMVVLSLADQI